MKKLYEACKKLQQLADIQGKNAKQDFVITNKEDVAFLQLLKARLNPFSNYKMNVIPSSFGASEPSLTFDAFIRLLTDMAVNNINNERRREVVKILQSADYRILEVLEGIITKTLNLGIDTGVNKALGFKFIPSFGVMLAAPLKEGIDVPIPCQVDVKYDGVRCLAVVNHRECTLYTRKGRVLTFPKLSDEILELANGQDLTFDGELEMEARTGVSGICNSNLKTGYVQDSDDLIKFTLFDVLPTDVFLNEGVSRKQSDRTLDLQKLFMNAKLQRVKLAQTQTVHSVDKLMAIANQYIADDLEGVIAKDPNAVYHFKRNKAWLKVKAINSTTLEIVGFEEGKGKRKGKVGALICQSSDGKVQVNVGSGLSDEMVELFTANPPVGKFAEVLFNVVIKGRDNDYYSLFLPRLKSGEAIRIDKTEADSFDKILDDHIGKPEI